MPLPTIKITLPPESRLRPEQRAQLDEMDGHAADAKGLLGEAERLADAAAKEHRAALTPETRAKLERVKRVVEGARLMSQRLNKEAANARRAAMMKNRQEFKENHEN